MMILKKIDSMSLAKIQGMIGVFVGLIAGLFVALMMNIRASMLTDIQGVESAGNLGTASLLGSMGWFAVIIAPILYGIFFFLAGLVSAWIYNLIARMVGGMKVDLEFEQVTTSTVQQPTQKQPQQPIRK